MQKPLDETHFFPMRIGLYNMAMAPGEKRARKEISVLNAEYRKLIIENLELKKKLDYWGICPTDELPKECKEFDLKVDSTLGMYESLGA